MLSALNRKFCMEKLDLKERIWKCILQNSWQTCIMQLCHGGLRNFLKLCQSQNAFYSSWIRIRPITCWIKHKPPPLMIIPKLWKKGWLIWYLLIMWLFKTVEQCSSVRADDQMFLWAIKGKNAIHQPIICIALLANW